METQTGVGEISMITVGDFSVVTTSLFDIIIFSGVLYHLRYPFWGLKVIRDLLKIGGQLIIETAIWEREPNNAILFCPTFNDSPYEGTSCTFFNCKGLIDTLASMGLKVSSTEYLSRNVKDQSKAIIKRLITYLQTMKDSLPSIRDLNRCVVISTYMGIDKNSDLIKYWERCHDFSNKCRNQQEYNALKQILGRHDQHLLNKDDVK